MMKYYLNYFLGFKGRINRLPYAIVTLLICLLCLSYIIFVFLLFVPAFIENTVYVHLYSILFYLYIPMSILSCSFTVRRLHDVNLPGWLVIITFVSFNIPVINTLTTIFLLVLCFIKGTDGPNQYGHDPLAAKLVFFRD